MTKRPLLFLLAGSFLLASAWLATTPPGAAPDEPAHYVKAVAVGQGQFLGRPLHNASEATWERSDWYQRIPEASRHKHAPFFRSIGRVFRIPRALAPPRTLGCNAFDPLKSADCLLEESSSDERDEPDGSAVEGQTVREASHFGTYPPLVYVVPGLASRLARDPISALLLGRAASTLIAFAFIAWGAAILWSRWPHMATLLALALILSPMMLFVSATLTTSGIEIAGMLCLTAGLLSLRGSDGSDARPWAAIGVAGSLVALARPAGPVWVVVALGLSVMLCGPRHLIQTLRKMRHARTALGFVSVAVLFGIAWQFLVQPSYEVGVSEAAAYIPQGFQDLGLILRSMVGVFGWMDTVLPVWTYAVWGALVLLLLTRAYEAGTSRDRKVLLISTSGMLFIMVVFTAIIAYPHGFEVQGRWVMPAMVLIPLLAAAVVPRETSTRIVAPRLMILIGVVFGAIHAISIYLAGQRHAVGIGGPSPFIGVSEWRPPGGWTLWLIVALMGAVLVALSFFEGSTSRPSSEMRGRVGSSAAREDVRTGSPKAG